MSKELKLIDINTTTGRKVYLTLCAAVVKQAVNDARRQNDKGQVINVSWYDNAEAKQFIQNIENHYFRDILNFGFLEIDLIKKAAAVENTEVIKLPNRVCGKKIRPDRVGKYRHWFNNGINNVLAVECPEGYKVGRCGAWKNQFSEGIK